MRNEFDPDVPHVARIVRMWADKVTGKMKIRHTWYYRPKETREGQQRPRNYGRHELFFSSAEDTNSVETIAGHARILDYDGQCA